MHPGFPGIHYMENAFNAMRPRIVAQLTKAVNDGMQK